MGLPIPFDLLTFLSGFAIRLGLPDPVAILVQWDWVDSATMREVGSTIWGANGALGPTAKALEETAASLMERLNTTVQDRWEGESYTQFREYLGTVCQALQDEAARLPIAGDVLVDIADKMELGLLELISIALTLAGFVVAFAGIPFLAAPGTQLAAVIISGTGLMLASASLSATLISVSLPRFDALIDAIDTLAVLTAAPSPLTELPMFPTDIEGWQPRNAEATS